MNIFVANIGNRDIAFNVGTSSSPRFLTFSRQDREDAKEIQYALKCEPGMRPVIRKLLTLYSGESRKKLLNMLRFPILRPALWKALEYAAHLDKIILICTDQDPEQAGEHYHWDTVEAAELLQELLSLESSLGPRLAGCPIEILKIERYPQQFEHAYQHLDRCLAPYAKPHNQLYASVNGGIPALNAALRIHALNLFGPRACLIETSEPSSDEEKRRGEEGHSYVANSWPYRRDTLLRVVRDLLAAYEYAGVLDVLERELTKAEQERYKTALALLEHGAARFNLNFAGARRALNGHRFSKDEDAVAWKQSAREDPLTLQRLHELAWTARILLERNDYLGFVVRAATLAETCRRQLVYLLIEINPKRSLSSDDVPDALRQVLNRNRSLIRHGSNWKVNQLVLNAIIAWGKDQRSDLASRTPVETAQRVIAELQGIESLRNQVVHRTAGVSPAVLKHAFPDLDNVWQHIDTLLKAMEHAHLFLGQGVEVTPVRDLYARLNEKVLATLRA